MSPPLSQDTTAEEASEPETTTDQVNFQGPTPDEGRSEQQKQQFQPAKNQQQSRNNNQRNNQQFSRQSEGIQKFRNNNKNKNTFKRIDVDPSRRYHTPEARESWGPNVKGKKFRKEKGKKKRSTGTGARIDGSVRSVRLDS